MRREIKRAAKWMVYVYGAQYSEKYFHTDLLEDLQSEGFNLSEDEREEVYNEAYCQSQRVKEFLRITVEWDETGE